jgi:hypothetical protein
MYLGFSKNLGGGFRIGIGTRFGSRKNNNSNKASLAKDEKQGFLEKMANLHNQYRTDFFQSRNIYYKLLEKIDKSDTGQLFKNKPDIENFKKANLISSELVEIFDKVKMGGYLTAKKKDKIIDLVYDLNQLNDKEDSELERKIKAINGTNKAVFIITIVATILALLAMTDYWIAIIVLGCLVLYANSEYKKITQKNTSNSVFKKYYPHYFQEGLK